MKLGIMCAMEEEMALIKADIVNPQIKTIAGRDFYSGTLYQQEVVLVISRVGKVAAASTATTLIDCFKVDQVIFTGTAGAIDSVLNVGDLVVGDLTLQHDVDAMGFGYDRFLIPVIRKAYFESNQAMTDLLFKSASDYIKNTLPQEIPNSVLEKLGIKEPKVLLGTIASGDQFISNKEKKDWLETHIKNLKCVEMEGAAVAQICYEFNVPFAIFRVISDSASETATVDFDFFIQEASHFTKGCLKTFLENFA